MFEIDCNILQYCDNLLVIQSLKTTPSVSLGLKIASVGEFKKLHFVRIKRHSIAI